LFKPRIEGRIAIVTDAGWNAVDAGMPFDERHAPRTAKSCGPGAPKLWRQVLALSQRSRADDGGKREGSPRRARISR